MDNEVKRQIKVLLAQENIKAIELIKSLNEKFSSSYSSSSFSHKLKNGTITYKEMLNIANILGYEIIFKKKDNF